MVFIKREVFCFLLLLHVRKCVFVCDVRIPKEKHSEHTECGGERIIKMLKKIVK